MLDPALVAILANPAHPDRPPLALRTKPDGGELLVCTLTGLGFPVEGGIPRLLPESAIPADETARLLGSHG